MYVSMHAHFEYKYTCESHRANGIYTGSNGGGGFLNDHLESPYIV